jgi:pyruvate dehydrogenase E2 component (dihydrolipoamide acetyltransferase)
MADVIMPQMGESIDEGTVTKWLTAVGDTIERDEPLFEISTDTVDAEIPAPAAGVLREIRVPPGTTVEVNTVVALIEEAGSASADAEPAAADGAPAQAETAPPAEPPAPIQQALPVEPSRPIPAPPPRAPSHRSAIRSKTTDRERSPGAPRSPPGR